jgi:hypothetical protein
MHNPLRSEAEMFRFVVIVGAGCAAVIAATLIFDATVGVILLAVLVGIGVGVAWRGSRGSERRQPEIAHDDSDVHRILVVANQTVGGQALLAEITNRAKGQASEIMVVVPALPGSRLDYWASATDEAVDRARERLTQSLAAIERQGLHARGEVGDADPSIAMEDALREFPADELVISTHPASRSKWLERGVVERAKEEIDLPVTHVVVDLEAEASLAR